MANADMKPITWDDVRKGDWLIIRQVVPLKGPRKSYNIEWCGEVIEHSLKGTYIKHAGHSMLVQHKWGEEEILRTDKKSFNAYVKENYA